MKKLLLFAALLAGAGMSAQTTHMVPWFMGVSMAQTSITIDAGDTVTWTWDDALPHTVTTQAGAVETFTSAMLTGDSQEYSHTFSVIGDTPYACNVHPMMMGTITTQATAGVGDIAKIDFEFYPNPATDVVTINGKNVIDRIQVYDVTGRQYMDATANTNSVKVYLGSFNAGTYFVKVFSGSQFKNITIVKK